MTAQPKIAPVDQRGPVRHQGFDPKQSTTSTEPEWVGKRREIGTASEVIPLRWPTTREAQLKAFDAWHDIAMQIVDRAGCGFRMMAIYEKVIRWKEGCIWDSDEELASSAGKCSWKTISREIATHKKLGIILVEKGWRRVRGKPIRTRTIKLAVPDPLPPEIDIRDLPNHTDTRGPYEEEGHPDTRGPEYPDTRGPITRETREEGASHE
ncbi:hypothetical protein [Sinorhizobium fredii]|uniref:hypothetical protein n=1 Tax=Rhizobium fredii TaxID=380 RepID=UPI003517492A